MQVYLYLITVIVLAKKIILYTAPFKLPLAKVPIKHVLCKLSSARSFHVVFTHIPSIPASIYIV